MSDFRISRRFFFFGSLFAGAVPPAGFGSVASLKALGYKPLNEKLNLAAVGVGGRGAQNLQGCTSENIGALCEVDSRQVRPSSASRKRSNTPISARCSTRKATTLTR
jgi:hypothetical protein